MRSADLLDILNAHLPVEDAARAFAALKRDPLVWNAVEDAADDGLFASADLSLLVEWTPANLVLKLLNSRLDLRTMQADHLPPIEPSIRKKALETFENVLRSSTAPATLREAGLIALALRERRRKTQTWQGLLDELKTLNLKGKKQLIEVWKTALACLFGMTPDPKALLAALLKPEDFQLGMAWISYILLANPMPEEERQACFHYLMADLPPARQVEWLVHLQRMGDNDWLPALAGQILRESRLTSGSLNLQADDPVEEKTWDELARQTLELQWAATLHQLAGHPAQAELLLEKERAYIQHWLAGSTFQLISIAGKNRQDANPYWDEAESLAGILPVSSRLIEEALWMAPPASYLNGINAGPVPELAQMFIAAQRVNHSQHHEVQSVAREAVQEWMKTNKTSGWQPGGQFVFDFSPWAALHSLQELGLFQEALDMGMMFLEYRVQDLELITWTSKLAHRLGKQDLAVKLIRQAILLEPQNLAYHRGYAEILENLRNWESAIAVRAQILDLHQPTDVRDCLALANCALGGGDYDLATSTAQAVLERDDDQGLAYAYLGLALEGKGDLEGALAHLSKATLLIPEDPAPWLELARIYHRKGDDPRAMETLRAAILNAPDSAELHLAIGQACLDSGLAADALPYLKQSARLAPESDEVALALARTMMSLGHEKEALAVVERARNHWPAHSGLAYQHACILIERGDCDQGIAVLEVALQSEQAQPNWFVDYARVLLDDQQVIRSLERPAIDLGRTIKAQKALQKVLKMQPEHFEARLLTAEILLLREDLQAAQTVFQQVLEADQASSPEWYWRIQSGVGLVGYRSRQFEMALASLQNAAQARPDSIETLRLLAETCYRAALFESAAEAAERAHALQPDGIGNLIWYADLMERMNLLAQGCAALRTATQLAPRDISLSLRLAGMLIRNNQVEEAKAELERTLLQESITAGQLETVAETAMYLGNLSLAESALRKAIALSLEPSFSLHFHLAQLLFRNTQTDPALNELQTALIINSDNPQAYILQSELQTVLNRPQAALASLERALRICESQPETPDGSEEDRQDVWGQIPVSRFAIHQRFVYLLEATGELNSALYHAEKALEACPISLEMRYTAADLSSRLLQPERMARIVALPESQAAGCFTSFSLNSDAEWLAGLQYFKAKRLLDQGNLDEAERAIQEGLAHQPEYRRLKIAWIRLLARKGNFPEAERDYADLSGALRRSNDVNTNGESEWKTGEIGGDTLAMAETAFDLFRWQDGLALAEAYQQRYENDPCSHLALAQGWVRMLEWQRTGQELELCRHQPITGNPEETARKAADALEKTAQLVRSRQIEHWQARAEMVKRPIAQNIQALLGLQPGDDDLPWVVEAFLRSGNLANAVQVAEQCSHLPLVQAMLALAHLQNDPDRALSLARDAVEDSPRHPIFQAMLARAAEQCGEYSQALEAFEIALSTWDDELHWHKRAARLAEICGEPHATRQHLEKALALAPQNFDLLLEVGKHYLQFGLFEQAVTVLQKAVSLDSARAAVWQMLAQAYQGMQNYKEAMQAVEKAVELDAQAGNAWVMGGEIALLLGDEARALNYARQAEKVSPAEAGTRLLAVRILIKRGQIREALEELNRAVEEIPENWELALERIRLVRQMQGAAAAMELLQPLVQRYPANDRVLALFAQTCAQTGRLKLAEQSAVQALKINPHQGDLHRLLAEVLKDQGQLDRAIHHYSEAVRLNSEKIDTYLDLGQVYVSRREYPQALAVLQQAARVDPDDYRPYYQSALVLRDSKDYPAAELMLRRAASLAPDDVNILRQLGAIIALNLVHHGQEAKSCL